MAYPELEPAPRRRIPIRVVVLVVFIVAVGLFANATSIRDSWAHRLGDTTNASWPLDYVVGLLVALLPVFGILLGSIGQRGPRRLLRMATVGAVGFVATFLLAPSPLRYLVNETATRHAFSPAPGYLPGVFTGFVTWLAAAIAGYVLLRSRWRRFVARVTGSAPRRPPVPPGDEPPPRVIDI